MMAAMLATGRTPDSPTPAQRASRQAAGAGFEFAASVGAMTILGYFVDRWLDTSPTWLLVGALVGFIGGGWNLYKAVKKMMRANERAEATARAVRLDDPKKEPAGFGSPASAGRAPVVRERELPPIAKEPPRRPRSGPVSDRGMFGRTQPTDDELAPEDEIRWPSDARANDTLDPGETPEGRD